MHLFASAQSVIVSHHVSHLSGSYQELPVFVFYELILWKPTILSV